MWQATEHGEAGLSLAPAPFYWSWMKTWTRCSLLGDIVCECANQIMEAGFVATFPSWSQRTLWSVSHRDEEQPAPTRFLRRQNRPVPWLFGETRKPWPSVEETVALHPITPNPRKAICNVLEIMWKDYHETYIFTSCPRRNIDVGERKNIRSRTDSTTW